MKLREIKLTPPIAAISAMLLVLTGTAAPKIVYVVPGGAGTKDGTSWENAMASVRAAYLNAAKYADGGFDAGEVWIKTGRYCESDYAILVPNTIVRGGFAGGETSADQADPEANPTILSGDTKGDDVWLPNGETPETPIPIWTGDDLMTFNHPDPEGKYDYCRPSPGATSNKSWAFYFAPPTYGTGALSGCRFLGLTFTGFSTSAIHINQESGDLVATGLEIRHCRFIANGTKWDTYLRAPAIYLTNVSGIIADCQFICNCCGPYVNTTKRTAGCGTALSIEDTVFERCARNGIYSSLYHNADSLTLSRCTFDSCRADEYAAVGLFCKQGSTPQATYSFTDCFFTNNLTTGKSASAVQFAGTDGSPSACHDFVRCLFVGNRLVNDSSATVAASACVKANAGGRNFNFMNCAFVGNTSDSGSSKGGWSVLTGDAANDYTLFLNCTLTGNRATTTAANAPAGTIGLASGDERLFVVNTTFLDNETTAVTENAAADCMMARNNGNTFVRFLNSIFWNKSADYVPYWGLFGTAWPKIWLSHCALKNLDLEAVGGISSSILRSDELDMTGTDPKFGPLRQKGLVWAQDLTKDSPRAYRKNGILPYLTDSKTSVAIRDPDYYGAATPWCLLLNGATLSDADAAEQYGLSPDAAPIPDAFDAARVAGRVSYGPLNVPDPGLVLLLK